MMMDQKIALHYHCRPKLKDKVVWQQKYFSRAGHNGIRSDLWQKLAPKGRDQPTASGGA